MSYARSPRPVCSTTNGTEAIPGFLSGSVARVIGTSGLQLLLRFTCGRGAALDRPRGDRLFLELRGADHQLQRLPLENRLCQGPAALGRRVVLAHPRGVLRVRVGETLHLRAHLVGRDLDALLLRQRGQQDLALE